MQANTTGSENTAIGGSAPMTALTPENDNNASGIWQMSLCKYCYRNN